MEAIRQFFRESLHHAIERCFKDDKVLSSSSEAVLFQVLYCLVQVGAVMLRYRASRAGAMSPQQLVEMDQDLVPLVACLALVFDPELAPHNTDWPLPEGVEHSWDSEWAEQLMVVPGTPAPDASDEEQEEHEESPWLVALLNIFGDEEGFNAVCQVCVRCGLEECRWHCAAWHW